MWKHEKQKNVYAFNQEKKRDPFAIRNFGDDIERTMAKTTRDNPEQR